MSYEFPIDPTQLLRERQPQFINAGLPGDDLDEVGARISQMWDDVPGGWLFEFSSLADCYARDGDMLRAALAYGVAHFPVLAGEPAKHALTRQKKAYLAAAEGLGVHLERSTTQAPYRDGTIAVPVHILSPAGSRNPGPVLMASGGLDTWKMDLHRIFEAFVRHCGVTVLAFDHPGTGETDIALDDGADGVVVRVVEAARELGDGRVFHFGLSFGGNFATMTALRGLVDGAINLGGPVAQYFDDFEQLEFGMRDILSNVLGFDSRPTPSEILRAAAPFDRRPLFDNDLNPPMLVINGADDVHVPRYDTEIFQGRRDTEVHLLPGTGHCAMSKLPQVIPVMTGWLFELVG